MYDKLSGAEVYISLVRYDDDDRRKKNLHPFMKRNEALYSSLSADGRTNINNSEAVANPSGSRLLSTRIRIKTEMFQGNRVHIITLHTLEFLNLDFQPNPL